MHGRVDLVLLVRVTLACCLCACVGNIATPPPPVIEPLPPIVEPPPPPFAPAPPGLKRLTRYQYAASVEQVFGARPMIPPLEPDTFSYHFANIGASDTSIGPSSAELYDTAALSIARQVVAASVSNVCGTMDVRGCRDRFVAHFGRLLFRRTLEADEQQRFGGLVDQGTAAFMDPLRGYERALAAMLASPFFLYRVELGDNGLYSGVELATRMSLFLWGSTPDLELLDAAESGRLDTDAGLLEQVNRLLAHPRARTSLMTFFDEHFTLDRLEGLHKPVFPRSTMTLGSAQRREIQLILEEVVFAQKLDVRRALDTDVAFVNEELAAYYGYPATQGWTRVVRPSTDPRAGVLSSGGFLSMTSGQRDSSPTLRGKFIKLSVLCEDIPPPPPGVVTELPAPMGIETTRERSERHQTVAECAGCHARMDPLGYALEGFDALGLHRTMDNGRPVNTRSVVTGTTVDGAKELAHLLASHRQAGPCLTRELYRYATGHVNLEGEDVVLLDVAKKFEASGFKFEALARAIVMSDGFRKAGAPR